MWIAIMIGLFLLQTITVLFAEYRNPSKAVAWLTIMIIIPVVGVVMYYFLAQGYKKKRRLKRSISQMSAQTRAYLESLTRSNQQDMTVDNIVLKEHQRTYAYLRSLSEAPITTNNTVTVYAECSHTYTAMLSALTEAVDHIHLQFYTIRSDSVGQQFQEILIAKAQEGVRVRVLYDGVGSYKLNKAFILELQQAGIEVSSFLPPLIAFFDKRVNYRNHRKIIIIDGKIGFMGGMNIGEEYMGGNPRLGYWRDTHLRIEGDAVYTMQHMFISDWHLSTEQSIQELARYYPEQAEQHKQVAVQLIASGPDERRDDILQMFFTLIASATCSVYVTTPYFIPDSSLSMALKTAVRSGVDVTIIIPYKADSSIVHWASLSYIEDMRQAGVKCYMYRKGFIHAKVIIVDRVMATVGTANMDMRSFFSNFELNAVMFDSGTVAELVQQFLEDLSNCTLFEGDAGNNRTSIQRVKEVGARLLSPLL